MSEQTAISWTDSTFNPWIGCTKVSPGCDHCYAERDMDVRRGRAKWGAGNPRSRTGAANWKLPERWNREDFCECTCGWRGVLKEPRCPICNRDGIVVEARRRVFCASLADVFDNEVPPAWQRDLFKLILDTPNLDWLLLTKRIGNVAGQVRGRMPVGHEGGLPPNVWLGVTIVNQEEADRDIPKLLAVGARVRFLSIEPMLGTINLGYDRWGCDHPRLGCDEIRCWRALNWVICGGESGPGARPMHRDWVRSLRDQCQDAGVPFHFKQWGEHAPNWLTTDGVHEQAGSMWMDRMGRKLAGRLLDGRAWNEFPA